MDEITFNSSEELYQRVKPALVTKKNEMKREGFSYVTEEDIWNYLKEQKWRHSNDLSLAEMVSDILNGDSLLIEDYFKTKLAKKQRRVYFEEDGDSNEEANS